MNGKARLLRLSAMPERSGNGKVEQSENGVVIKLRDAIGGTIFWKKIWGPSKFSRPRRSRIRPPNISSRMRTQHLFQHRQELRHASQRNVADHVGLGLGADTRSGAGSAALRYR